VSKSHSACRNYFVRVGLTVVSVVVTFVLGFNIILRVITGGNYPHGSAPGILVKFDLGPHQTAGGNYTLRVELTLCVWKLHSVCWNHTLRVEITLCIYKSHSAFMNPTRACWYHTLRSEITLCVCSSQYACEHHTQELFLHAECGFNTNKCHNYTYLRVEIITLCVWTSQYACEHHNMRVFWKFDEI
jgi:hypothetical protein